MPEPLPINAMKQAVEFQIATIMLPYPNWLQYVIGADACLFASIKSTWYLLQFPSEKRII